MRLPPAPRRGGKTIHWRAASLAKRWRAAMSRNCPVAVRQAKGLAQRNGNPPPAPPRMRRDELPDRFNLLQRPPAALNEGCVLHPARSTPSQFRTPAKSVRVAKQIHPFGMGGPPRTTALALLLQRRHHLHQLRRRPREALLRLMRLDDAPGGGLRIGQRLREQPGVRDVDQGDRLAEVFAGEDDQRLAGGDLSGSARRGRRFARGTFRRPARL